MRRFNWIYGLGLAASLGAGLLSARPAMALQTDDAPGEVVVLEATGVVVPAMAGYLERGLREADSLNAEAVIVVLNTPGGPLGTTLDIVQDFRTSDVPVIVFVGPRGAGAGSAGLLITLAGHASAMAPETAIGATSPVGPQGEDLPTTSEEKAKEFVGAQARSLAERRGEAALQLADDAVNEARAVSATEALEANLIDYIVEDVPELLATLDGTTVEVNGQSRTLHTRDVQSVEFPMNTLERILTVITHPNMVASLLTIGTLLIFIEIRTPGGWVAGTLGTIFLGLAFYGLGVLPVNWLGIVFVILAFALFILEIKAPAHGVLTVVGAASLAVGAIILFSQPEIAPFGQISIPLVIGQSVMLAALFFFLAMMALRAQSRRPTTGYSGLVGQVGRVTQDLDPSGIVQVWGERWRADSADGELIATGTLVEVIEANDMRVFVQRRQPRTPELK